MDDGEYLRRVSYGMYKIVNDELGSKEVISMRHTVGEFSEQLQKIHRGPISCDHLKSGSWAEGLRFTSSDIDTMIVYKYFVLEMADNTPDGTFDRGAMLRIETDVTRPGFCLLRMVSGKGFTIEEVPQMFIPYRNGLYLSSTLWKDARKGHMHDSINHGPCESGILGVFEVDYCHCLKSSQWPRLAYPCIQNLYRIRWPSIQVLSSIVSKGCHMVPIGDKTSHKEPIEWRISFSEAEKTLIREMKHCQFLTYGLLKIFLKDVINTRQDVRGLLCSYFLKTAVLWEISYNGPQWKEIDFLEWFWACFRRLLTWVSDGYCPNFFISENNMFLGKIQGRSQQDLLRHLTSLYGMGYKCLLGCKSLFLKYGVVLQNPNIVIMPPFDNDQPRLKIELDANLINEIRHKFNHNYDMQTMSRCILYLEQSCQENETYVRCVILDSLLRFIRQQLLFHSAQHLQFHSPVSITCNRMLYSALVKHLNALKVTRYNVSGYLILSGTILYKLGMHHHVKRIVQNALRRIKSRHVICTWDMSLSKYRLLGGDHTPVDIMMRKCVVDDESFTSDTCLPELQLEHRCVKAGGGIAYSPVVFLNALLFLSCHHLSHNSEAKSVLHELKSLMNNDDGVFVHNHHKAISWELLGICQEITGYFEDAIFSYQRALQEPCYNSYRQVTVAKIEKLNSIIRMLK